MNGSIKSVLIHQSGINEFAFDESGFNDADLISLIRMMAVELQDDRQILDLQGLACLIELQESSCVVELGVRPRLVELRNEDDSLELDG